jgi:hypothetical protein
VVGTTKAGGNADALSCADVFDQSKLQDYWIDISADELAKMQAEFHDVASVLAGTPNESYHPIVFHFGGPNGETVTDAAVRLKGQSSWVLTVENDPDPKMQIVIAFNQKNAQAKFHGLTKLAFDMPRSDWTFLHERLANAWWRQRRVMAPCSNSGRLYINGAYYGLYVVEEHVGHELVKQFFPANPGGNLFKGGVPPDQNNGVPDLDKLSRWQAATDIPSMLGLVDLDTSVLEWAGDALLNNGDGYYGGSHNFMIYDQGQAGYVWLPADNDSTFDWLSYNSPFVANDHPLYWWEGRPTYDPPGQHYLAVINDPTWRKRYVDAIATAVQGWNTAEVQSWIDAWSQQIATAVAEDPHKQATVEQWQAAVAVARQVAEARPAFLQDFVACERGQGGADADGDGVPWCDDCRDDDPAVHPGAPEICGNHVDDNCNGLVDEGCPAGP